MYTVHTQVVYHHLRVVAMTTLVPAYCCAWYTTVYPFPPKKRGGRLLHPTSQPSFSEMPSRAAALLPAENSPSLSPPLPLPLPRKNHQQKHHRPFPSNSPPLTALKTASDAGRRPPAANAGLSSTSRSVWLYGGNAKKTLSVAWSLVLCEAHKGGAGGHTHSQSVFHSIPYTT